MATTQLQPDAPDGAQEATQGENGKREQSTIAFPYLDLNEGIKIAKAVFEVHGSTCQADQAAAQIKESPTSSSFRMKISSAKTFGLVTTGQGALTLTKLGSQICDAQQEKAARVEAFLTVPLYRAVYDKFRGSALPPNAGLEAAMVSLGVSEKQKDRARQIFQRSAQEAGFFQFGNDRLVQPAIKASTAAPAAAGLEETEEPEETEAPEKRKKSRDSGGDEHHPFIQGLLRKLPPAETDWPMEGRSKWLEAAIKIFDLMYTDSDDSRRSISIELKKDSAAR
jgi:hypothetical protein